MAIAFCRALLFRMSSGTAWPTMRRGRDILDVERAEPLFVDELHFFCTAKAPSWEDVVGMQEHGAPVASLGWSPLSAWATVATLATSQAPVDSPSPLQLECMCEFKR